MTNTLTNSDFGFTYPTHFLLSNISPNLFHDQLSVLYVNLLICLPFLHFYSLQILIYSSKFNNSKRKLKFLQIKKTIMK